MKFSKSQKIYQKRLNERILAEWDDAISYYYEVCDFDPSRIKWKRLKNCSAWICHLDGFNYLKSYDTIVAVFVVDEQYILYDNLRYVYGYTATSAQHISKFYNEMRYAYHLLSNEIEICRYYPV